MTESGDEGAVTEPLPGLPLPPPPPLMEEDEEDVVVAPIDGSVFLGVVPGDEADERP